MWESQNRCMGFNQFQLYSFSRHFLFLSSSHFSITTNIERERGKRSTIVPKAKWRDRRNREEKEVVLITPSSLLYSLTLLSSSSFPYSNPRTRAIKNRNEGYVEWICQIIWVSREVKREKEQFGLSFDQTSEWVRKHPREKEIKRDIRVQLISKDTESMTIIWKNAILTFSLHRKILRVNKIEIKACYLQCNFLFTPNRLIQCYKFLTAVWITKREEWRQKKTRNNLKSSIILKFFTCLLHDSLILVPSSLNAKEKNITPLNFTLAMHFCLFSFQFWATAH